jgi:hypothetical protein
MSCHWPIRIHRRPPGARAFSRLPNDKKGKALGTRLTLRVLIPLYRRQNANLTRQFAAYQCNTNYLNTYSTWGEGVNRGIQIRRSAQIWSKIRDPTMVLSKFNKIKALLWSHNHAGSELNYKLNPQSEPKYKINPQSAVLIRSANPCKIFARSEIRTIFSVKSDDPKTYSPPPPLKGWWWILPYEKILKSRVSEMGFRWKAPPKTNYDDYVNLCMPDFFQVEINNLFRFRFEWIDIEFAEIVLKFDFAFSKLGIIF